MRHAIPLGSLLPLALLASACGGSGSVTDPDSPSDAWAYRVPEQVADGWETGSLEAAGLDPAPLARLMNDLESHPGHLVHSILIVRDGRLVFEEYFSGRTHPTFGEEPVRFDKDTWHSLSSVTKSLAATALGVAIDRGFIHGVDEPVLAFFPGLEDLNAGQKADLTLEDLVTMTAGLEWDESTHSFRDPRNDLIAWLNLTRHTTGDPVRAVLERPLVAAPGAHFNYNGGLTNVLGQAIQNATGRRLDDFVRDRLFAPLGIDQVWWWLLRDDFVYASGDIALRPRDLARVGLLYLNDGVWNGERILSSEWVEASARTHTPFSPSDYGDSGTAGYSYGWWTLTSEYGPDAFAAWGWGGQKLIVLPGLDMVVVFTGGSYWDSPRLRPHQMMTRNVLPAVR